MILKGGFTVDWKKLKAEYIAGGTSYRKLAEKYGVTESKIARRAKKENWSSLATQNRRKTDAKIIESVSDEQAEEAVSAVSLINESALNMLRQIAKETVEGVDTSKIAAYTRAVKLLKEVLDIKSPRDIKEQNARIANLERQAEADKTADNKIVVEFGGAEVYGK